MSGLDSDMETLRQSLAEWTDFDKAAYVVAVTTGLLDSATPIEDTKHVFWTSNELMDALGDILDVLVQVGALEWSPDREQYRWRAAFVWDRVSVLPGRSRRGRPGA